MASGNATYTYIGEDDESPPIEGTRFPKGVAVHLTDQGVIAQLSTRDDFSEGEGEPKPKRAAKAKAE